MPCDIETPARLVRRRLPSRVPDPPLTERRRAQFHEACKHVLGLHRGRDSGGRYTHRQTASAWRVWQAACDACEGVSDAPSS